MRDWRGYFISHQNLRNYQQGIKRLQIAFKLNAGKSSYSEFTICQERWPVGEFPSPSPHSQLFWPSAYHHIPNPLTLISPWPNQTKIGSSSLCLPPFISSDSPYRRTATANCQSERWLQGEVHILWLYHPLPWISRLSYHIHSVQLLEILIVEFFTVDSSGYNQGQHTGVATTAPRVFRAFKNTTLL